MKAMIKNYTSGGLTLGDIGHKLSALQKEEAWYLSKHSAVSEVLYCRNIDKFVVVLNPEWSLMNDPSIRAIVCSNMYSLFNILIEQAIHDREYSINDRLSEDEAEILFDEFCDRYAESHKFDRHGKRYA